MRPFESTAISTPRRVPPDTTFASSTPAAPASSVTMRHVPLTCRLAIAALNSFGDTCPRNVASKCARNSAAATGGWLAAATSQSS